MLSQPKAAALEALLDEELGVLPPGAVPPEIVEELEADGFLEPGCRDSLRADLVARAVGRPLLWGATAVTQGEVLASFAAHCALDLDDIDVVAARPAELVVRWRDETSRFVLRNGVVGGRALRRRAATDGDRRARCRRGRRDPGVPGQPGPARIGCGV